MTLYVHRDAVPMRWWIAAALMLLWVATWHTALLNVTAVLAFGYTAVYLATRPAFARGRLTPRADISYGVYLYGFLAEQVAVSALGSHAGPLTVLLLAGPLIVGAAMLSWRFVEAPALRLKSRLGASRRAASSAQAAASVGFLRTY